MKVSIRSNRVELSQMKKIFTVLLFSMLLSPSILSGEDVHPIALLIMNTLIEPEPSLILDVRTVEEYTPDHIPTAVNLPVKDLSIELILRLAPDMNQPVFIYCQSGKRSNQAASLLKSFGYLNVYDLGSINNWTFGTLGKLAD
jgi:rhodanese-related sulfurtransferase